MTGLATALVAVPALAACLGLAVGRARPRLVVPVAVGGAGLSAVLAVVLAVDVLRGRIDLPPLLDGPAGPNWVTGSDGAVPDLRPALTADPLAVVVAVAVTVVALLVQVYSAGYLRGDPRTSSYAALVSLFTAAMLLVVLAGDLLVLFVGWEVMGACSYFLVGHHWEEPAARAAAVKAFLVTRVGDVCLLFGVFGLSLGEEGWSSRLGDVLLQDPSTVVLLLVLVGALGKSAQFPLHVWLPDAMAGPTPVSALIHAATMVAAGVYLVARLWPLFAQDTAVLAVLAVVAAVTMVGAALAALAQPDLKRVLAWSTVSQLAVMFGGLAVAAPVAAVFHLLAHAAFKALLFLAAGAVMHALGTSLLRDMGGLRRAMPVTAATTAAGLLALVGVPPLSGFWSKDAVLTAAEEVALHPHAGGPAAWTGWLVLVAGLLTVALTAAYCARLWLLAFAGERRGAAEAHEAPAVLRWPLVALAVPTALLGLLAVPGWLDEALEELPGRVVLGASSEPAPASSLEIAYGGSLAPSLLTSALSVLLLLAGAGAVLALHRRDPAGDPAAALGRARPVLEGAYGLDALYDRVLVRPSGALARLAVAGDRDVVDAYVRGSGRGAQLLGAALRLTQRGSVQGYLTGLLAGVVVLAVAGAVGLGGGR
ncbi:NADH-quinone oxidoreductase subunit L [Vallicoccus soli]|uniref:NADH-quinone oxidoreductase subunit L n=1 Tax=Vallicoccus soli TaxID=2339232 RepID=A0A3A3YPZ2_9ACTN|nr:NADH-quinone oxidoreductase subunit L [Vallicoccus soli]RJK93424.1 NADH-quinone oxidoreductase subunit L [Vallicoccus soli]